MRHSGPELLRDTPDPGYANTVPHHALNMQAPECAYVLSTDCQAEQGCNFGRFYHGGPLAWWNLIALLGGSFMCGRLATDSFLCK